MTRIVMSDSVGWSVNKYAGYLTSMVSGVVLSILFIASPTFAQMTPGLVLELTKAEAEEVLNDFVPNARLTGEFNVGRYIINHSMVYPPAHALTPVMAGDGIRVELAKGPTDYGCAMTLSVVHATAGESSEPVLIGICTNGLLVKLYFGEGVVIN